jgi:hypothetical protein
MFWPLGTAGIAEKRGGLCVFLLMMEMWKWVVTEISECGDIGTLGFSKFRAVASIRSLG